MTGLQQRWRASAGWNGLALALVCVLAAWSMWWAEFRWDNLSKSGPRFFEFFSRLTPPDWSVTRLLINSTFETLMITLAGTFVAVIVALPVGFLAASNVSPSWVSMPLKAVLGVVRSVPLILAGLLFVSALGLGAFPGALAIAFHSVGMLGKFYAEEFETADKGIINAVQGTGATWLQTVRFGLLPQCIPQLVAFTVYRFEMNFRDATILGIVGAGGIGFYISMYIGSFQYQKVAVLLILIVGVVLVLDQLTYWVRRWIR
ncbi:MAG: phosphonate ABC transporter, permease protein PhnE [Candidatus Hydrogenedentota bacterium]